MVEIEDDTEFYEEHMYKFVNTVFQESQLKHEDKQTSFYIKACLQEY